ncbi:IclR family transcriptional regulator [Humitalea rosea]|uniref:IclR family transcriptional regulator n=1 Tax=Humitalea rosea TaxID=990373 RepID=A0A2W7KQ68_9PROT|nr:IclR family transcriptional regulator [Humitalea rosea]PZW50485.1 IclR family transcriptional regulator [Humitalea rosea]
MSVTVEKALQLIEAMARAGKPVGVSQLGRDLQINKSTVHRLLDTLVRQGYACQEEDSGRYALSVKLWEMGIGVVRGLSLPQVARPLLEAAALETGETTMLGVVQEREVLIIDKVDSLHPLQIFSPLGTRLPICNSAFGRVLLAFQPEAFIEAAVAEFAPRTAFGIQTQAQLREDLARIRAEGSSQSRDEWQIGIAGAAASIHDAKGGVAGAFCITGPTARLTEAKLRDCRARCVAASQAISQQLGHIAPGPARQAAGAQ